MQYFNPKIPEEINYSKENPLKEFFYLVIGIFLLIAVFVGCVHLFAQNFAHYIPFAYEEKIFPNSFEFKFGETGTAKQNEILTHKKQAYLAELADKLASRMNLPEGMHIHINYVDTETVNAGATLNGQIFIYQGLLDFVESENELAMVIAHEIAHIKARHPIKALSSGLIIGITLSIISGSIDNGATASILTSGSTLTSLSFSRKQESQADRLALQALQAHYGHTKGSHDFFKRLHNKEKASRYLQFINTHPGSNKRIKDIQVLEQTFPNNNLSNNELQALPDFIH